MIQGTNLDLDPPKCERQNMKALENGDDQEARLLDQGRTGIGSMEEEIENHHDPKEIESTENVSVTEIIGTLNKGIGKWIETKTEIKKGVEKKIDVPIGIEVTNVKENGQKDPVEVTELKKNPKVGREEDRRSDRDRSDKRERERSERSSR